MKKMQDWSKYNPEIHDLHAKTSCKKCYGRGYIGRDSKTKQKIQCKCLSYKDKEVSLIVKPTLKETIAVNKVR
jgi:hypothetical protein